MMNPIRIGLGILLATLVAGPARPQEQSAPPATAAASAHPFRIRVGASIAASQLVRVVQPEYPADVKITGTVVLHAVIDYNGTVMTLEVVSGPDELKQAAVDAVKQWRYRPTKLDGQAAQVDTTINVVFALDKKGRLKPQPRNP